MFHVKHKIYDVLIVGGGHAGVEAATTASRLGMKTAVITFSKNDIGTLSCNPAMGGLGKGHLIREIDALGGLIGLASDKSEFSLDANKTRGAAVQGPRAQIDRNLHKSNMLSLIQNEEVEIIIDEVENIGIENREGKKTVNSLLFVKPWRLRCKSIIITTGTFFRG